MDKQEFMDMLDSIDNTHYACDIVDTIYMRHNPDEYMDMTEQDFIDYCIDNYVHTYEVIYYHRAMEYLMENDPSLRESTELAQEYGYEAESLNSELLATIHIQNVASAELWELV